MVVAASIVIIGGVLQRPLLVGVVPSDSMAPALNHGDLVFIVPSLFVRKIDVGTVVVFRSLERPWVVHRLVGGDAQTGFVSRGDANPEADSARVRPSDIAGVVPSWHGTLLHLPGVGTLTERMSPLRDIRAVGVLFVAGLVLFAVEGRRRKGPRVKSAWERRTEPLTVLATLALTVWTVVALQTALSVQHVEGKFVVVSSSKDGLAQGEVLAGKERSQTLTLHNPFPVPVVSVVVLEVDGVSVAPDRMIVPPFRDATYKLAISGTRPPGEYPFRLRRFSLLPVLPVPVLAALARVNMAALAAVTGLVPALILLALGMLDPTVRNACRLLLLRISMI